MIRTLSFCLSAILVSFSGLSQEIDKAYNVPVKTISGRVVDVEGKALEYVNIGIQRKDFGTMSFRDGLFELGIPHRHLTDTLTFSHLGFETVKLPIAGMTSNETIVLFSEMYSLSEVTITASKVKRQKIGITMHSPFVGATARHNEWAVYMKPRKFPAKPELLNIYINWIDDKNDSVYFRVNFYAVTDSMPGENVTGKNIVIRHLIQKGWNELDLRPFNVYLTEEFFVSFEWLTDLDQKASRSFHYGAVLIRPRKMYIRNTSFGTWRKIPGAVNTMTLQVLY